MKPFEAGLQVQPRPVKTLATRHSPLATSFLLSFLLLSGCAGRGTVTHRVTIAQHSALSVVGAFEDAETAEYAKGFVPIELHLRMQTAIQKVALGFKDLDTALAANASATDLKTKLDAIYLLLDSLNSDGILGIKNTGTKATLELALDAIKAVVDNALLQVEHYPVAPVSAGL
jgi:hypothetical protein